MPEWRKLHTKILDSKDVNEMPDDFTRLLWVLLTLVVDKEGRGINEPAWIRSHVFPIREDVTIDQINKSMSWFSENKMICVYFVGGRGYFYIPTWHQYQNTAKDGKSVLPDNNNEGAYPLQSNSRPTPDLLHSKSSTEEKRREENRIEEKRIEENRDHASFSSIEEDPFEEMRIIVQEVTGLPISGANGIKAVNDLVEMGATKNDIKDGYEWIENNGSGYKYAGQLVGPVKTSISKRLKTPIKKKQPEPVFAEEWGRTP
jgi:hypothetical protein